MATVKLTEVFKQNQYTSNLNEYKIRPVYVNPDFVVCLREDEQTLGILQEDLGVFPSGFDTRHQFTKVKINGGQGSFEITVVGDPDTVGEKLSASKTSLLRG